MIKSDPTDSTIESSTPIVQLCIDVVSLDVAIEVGKMGLRAGVDWLELGTPLVSWEGINSFKRFTETFPNTTTFLDAKVMDASGRYVKHAAELGIDLVCLCAAAADATFNAAIAAAKDSGTKIVGDLLAVPDPVGRARQLAALGVHYVYLHFGFDQRNEDPDQDRTMQQIRMLKAAVGVPIGIVVFDTESAVQAVKAGADILLVSHPFLIGENSEAMLAELVQAVKSAPGHT